MDNETKMTSPSKTDILTVPPTLQRIVSVIEQAVSTGVLTVNCPGALIHITPSGVGLVVPKIYTWLSEQFEVHEKSIRAALDPARLPDPHFYAFPSKKRRDKGTYIPVNLLVLERSIFTGAVPALSVNPHLLIDPRRRERRTK